MRGLFVVLLAGHLLGDFVFQSDKMSQAKQDRFTVLWHCLITTLATFILLGNFAWGFWIAGAVLLSHFLVDWVKSGCKTYGVYIFLADQAAHIILLYFISRAFESQNIQIVWTKFISVQVYYAVLLLLSGLIITVSFGGVLIVKAIKPIIAQLDEAHFSAGLKNGGKIIGQLERTLIYLLVLSGQFSSVGFLFAAKSILRFGEIREPSQRKEAEYIIIGTFMSFGWALLISVLVKATLSGVVLI